MRISDWSSDVCSSDLPVFHQPYTSSRRLARLGSLARIRRRRSKSRSAAINRSPPSASASTTPHGSTISECPPDLIPDRKSVVEGKRGSVRVVLGGRRIIKKKKHRPKQAIREQM